MKRIFTFFVFAGMLFFNGNVFGQVSIAFQGFESGDNWTISSGANISSNTGSSDYPANQRIRTGSNSHQTINTTRTLILNGFSDNTHTDRFVNVWLSSTSGTSGNGADGADYVEVYISSSSSFGGTPEIRIEGNSNVRFGMDGTGVVTTTVGNPYTYTYPSGGTKTGDDAKSKIEITDIPNSWTEIHLKIITKNNSSSERWNIDDIELFGTPSSSNDSDAYAGDTGSQPAAGTISSTSNDEESEAKDVFDMILYDGGTSDDEDTHVTRIRLKPNSTNTADWTDNIQGVVVKNGATIISTSSVDITDTYIDINFNSGDLDVADENQKTITISVYLNTSNIEDGKILSFMVDVDDHGFTADASGTQFKSDFGGGDFYSNDFTIDVEASELRFVQQPSDTEVNQTMSPAVTVEATDENGNRDLDFASDIAITSTGTLSGSPVKSTASSGLATFSSLVHTATGTGLTLNAERDGTGDWDVTSTTFDITPAPAPVCYEEHFDGDVPDGWTNNGTANETTGTHAGAAPNCRALGTGDDIFTPSFDYPEQLEFYQDASSGGNGNTATLEYRIGNSGTWTSLYSFNVTTDGKTETVDLTDVDGVDLSAEQDVFIKFLSSFYTWYLDDVVIRGGSCSLGIELVDFKVEKQNSNSKVSWTTSSELNNDYFSLEWSRDGRNFKEIAQIKSKGNHRENQEYGFTHRNPSLGTNYYRLTQYDLDGRSETFNVVSVTFDFDKQDMIIAPNKVNNNLIIEFSKPVENGSLLIYDMEGQMIKNSILAKGIDMINLDVSGLPSGQYIVKYLDVKGTATKKFVKI